MKACDRCGRTERQTSLHRVAVAIFKPDGDGYSLVYQPGHGAPLFDRKSMTNFLCSDCESLVRGGVRDLLATPDGAIRPALHLSPGWSWATVVFGVLVGLMCMAAGVCFTMAYVTSHQLRP